ncbi:MAG: threonine ammonia-lyase, biosynthetic [Betaproteobacteria bacterium AqS2]|uniref:L-threonine dehydratase n=1 Tax=Candidatus Amphirhobacter heronislandensis TaxID=1732024 RepID=A0A930UGP7_9GAMM|nr:threonine ammonia-lyase, biosynthetic [Betaproteobacteria bacterium AqS2]
MKTAAIVSEALTSPIYQHLRATPLTEAARLGAELGCRVLLKREDQQPVFSFKVRGAYHKMLKLPAAARRRGVVAASAGNHAQGVAHAARALGLPSHIFMPEHTPSIKIQAVDAMGAKVFLHGNGFDQTLKAARAHARKHDLPLFHPFDDYDVICGQATIGAELLREMPPSTEAVFVACGGGGLLAGIAAVIKHLRPGIKVFGVEPVDAACMDLALRKGRLAKLDYVGTFAETVAVAQAGTRNFRICKEAVDGMFVVDIGAICNAIKAVYEDTRTIVEPAGALGVAGARAYHAAGRHKGGDLVPVVCGANMNFDALRYVIERSAAGEDSEMLLAAEIPERPGSFLKLCRLLGKRQVREFNYRYSDSSQAHIFAGISVKDQAERRQIVDNLAKRGITAHDLTGDETAELHVRHMVGGRTSVGINELVYRFEFPETAGALLNFLSRLQKDWNISLFHYRFHGADVGRVLIGFQAEPGQRRQLTQAFDAIGYPYWPVSGNAAYGMFLADTKLSRPD